MPYFSTQADDLSNRYEVFNGRIFKKSYVLPAGYGQKRDNFINLYGISATTEIERKLRRSIFQWYGDNDVQRLYQVAIDLSSGLSTIDGVANMVDIAARDLSEVIAPLPAFNCNSTTMVSEQARKRADKRGEIVNGYVDFSNLQAQMFTAADRYVTYGFVPAQVEIDEKNKMPRIRFFDSIGSYPVIDRFGRVVKFYQRIMKPTTELMGQYPELANLIYSKDNPSDITEIVRYHDKDQDVLFIPNRSNLILDRAVNPIGEVMIRIVQRPSIDEQSRGQFDDVLAVQVAKARYALLSLEAATKAVQAPIAMPTDVQELALGPDAIMRSQKPNEIRRVPLEIPAGAFAQQGVLEQELRLGSRYPESRTGNLDASIVTGRGVQALMSGFDTQIKTAHSMFARAFVELVGICFKVDEVVFGNVEKELKGNYHGTPYSIKYKPLRDIDGDHTVDVQYGLMAGLDPNRALVFGLQARGDKLNSQYNSFHRECSCNPFPIHILLS